MKALMLIALLTTLGTTTSAHALIIGDDMFSEFCTGDGDIEPAALPCMITTTTSLPTMIVGADFNEMSEAEIKDFARAEAQNYVDGVEGEYLLLKKTASAMNLSVDEVAHEILAGK